MGLMESSSFQAHSDIDHARVSAGSNKPQEKQDEEGDLSSLFKNLKSLTSEECYMHAENLLSTLPNTEPFIVFLSVLVRDLQGKHYHQGGEAPLEEHMYKAHDVYFESEGRRAETDIEKPVSSAPIAPVIDPLKVFLIVTAQTYGAHQQFLDQLNSQGSKVTPTDDLQQSEVILLFCPVVSRVGSDVEAAVRKIPDGGQGKPVVLVLMHHNRKPDLILDQTQWSDHYPSINHVVHLLYHETQRGLLQCPRNQEAVLTIHRMCQQYMKEKQSNYSPKQDQN